jgi:hypothetical protein
MFRVDPAIVTLDPATAAAARAAVGGPTATPDPETPEPPPALVLAGVPDAVLEAKQAIIVELATAGQAFEEALGRRAPEIDAVLLALLERRVALEARLAAGGDPDARARVSGLALLWRRLRAEAARGRARATERALDAALSALDPGDGSGDTRSREAAARAVLARAVGIGEGGGVDIFSFTAKAASADAAASPSPITPDEIVPPAALAAEAASLAALARSHAADLRREAAAGGARGDRAAAAAADRDGLAKLLARLEALARELG